MSALRYAGTDNKTSSLARILRYIYWPRRYEVRDVNVITDGELAFVHSLSHVKGTLASGHITDL
jgi:ketosteroid isomerase-like protein